MIFLDVFIFLKSQVSLCTESLQPYYWLKLVVQLVPPVHPSFCNPTSLKSPILCLLQLIPVAVYPLTQAWKCQAVLSSQPTWKDVPTIWGPEYWLKACHPGSASAMCLWRRTVKPHVFCPGKKKMRKRKANQMTFFPWPRLFKKIQGATIFVALQ